MAMKSRIALSLLAAALLAACQGSGSSSNSTSAPPSGGTGQTTSPSTPQGASPTSSATPTFGQSTTAPSSLILVPSGTHSLGYYVRDPWTGALVDRGYVPTGQGPDAVAVSDDRYVYVANGKDGTVSAYAWESQTDRLTSLGTAIASGPQPASLAVVGSDLYALNTGNDTITAFGIGANGTLTVIGSITPSATLTGLVAGPGVLYGLAADGITTFSAGNGMPSGPSTTPLNGIVAGATDSAGNLYVLTSSGVYGYAAAGGGTLTSQNSQPLPSGLTPVAITVTGNGLAITGNTSSGIETAYYPASGGTISGPPVSSLSGRGTATAITASPGGHYVFVSNGARADLLAYALSPGGSGATLTSSAVLRTRLAPTAALSVPVTVTMQPQTLYVVNQSTTSIAAYPIEPGGTLGTPASAYTCNACTTNIADQGPSAAAIAPDGLHLYASDWAQAGQGDVTTFAMSPANGPLGAPSSLPAGQSPMGIAVDPSGRYLYVANSHYDDSTGQSTGGTIDAYSLSQGMPSPLGTGYRTQVYGNYPMLLAIDPTGRFLYSSEFAGSLVDAFAINPDNGSLTPASGVLGMGSAAATGTNPWTIVIGPSGRHLYVSDNGNGGSQTSGVVSIFTINAQNGTLTSDNGVDTTDLKPLGLVMGPKGRRLYVAMQNGSGALDVFVRQNPQSATGTWNYTPTVIQGNFTNAYGLALSADGKTLYVLDDCTAPNYNNGSIQAISIPSFSDMTSVGYTTIGQYATHACTVQAVAAGGFN